MANEAVPEFKEYPVIGRCSHEQVKYLRHDPYPYIRFEHLIAEDKAEHVRKEIVHSLIAFGLLGFLIYGGMWL